MSKSDRSSPAVEGLIPSQLEQEEMENQNQEIRTEIK